MTNASITVYADETDPDTRLAWYVTDGTGTLRDFTGWTLAVEVINRATNTVVYEKTSGVTGGDGTGSSNVVIAWTAADLAEFGNGNLHKLRVAAVNGSETAVFAVDRNGTLPLIRALPVPATP